MKYLYIELVGFKRFSLNHIERFSMTITQAVQLILGTNGSGKSSLMEQISPLPAVHSDFSKQGSKLIKISHNQHIYTLKSVFSPSQKHSFLRGDEELNEGGTVTVQRELVKRHFGITPELHDLALGNECFTNMSPSRRKEWFIRLCDTNYDYAIKVYNKLREKHRDVQGAIKLAKIRLVKESEKLIQDDEEKRMHQEAQRLHECLQELTEYRKPIEQDLELLQIMHSELDNKLFRVAKTLKALQESAPKLSSDEAYLEDILTESDQQLHRARAFIEAHTSDYHKNQKKIDALQKAEQQTIETIESSLLTLQQEQKDISATLLFPQDVERASSALEAFLTVRHTLIEVYGVIPENRDRRYRQEFLRITKEERAALETTKVSLNEKLQNKRAKLMHLLEHKDRPDAQCPGCHHKFSLRYDEQEHMRLELEISQMQNKLDQTVLPEIQKLDEYLTQCSEYVQHYRQYMQCVNGWPILAQYWAWLGEEKVLIEKPSSGMHYLAQIENDLRSRTRLEAIHKQIEDKQKLLTSLRDVGGSDLASLIEENRQLDEALAAQSKRLLAIANEKTWAQQDKQRLIQLRASVAKVRELIQSKRQCNKDEIETIRRTELNGAIRQLHSALASRENVLSSVAQQKQIVDHIAHDIANLEKEEQALGILVKQLSPTEGLIAEGLYGFIHNFIHQMNLFIQKVWTYPLAIQGCSMEEGDSLDMDYRFPLLVQGNDNRVSDVAKGSVGMKEIINLAYRLTAMRYLGLQEYPLILDEWGGAMDEAHRHHASYVIKSLVEQNACSQLFMVSHYFAQYGALSNAEICVLNNLNITVPKEYNTHVSLS